MAKEGGYRISDIYEGGYSSFEPSYGSLFTGYRVAANELGAPTKPDTANQIQQVNQLLNQGIVPIEVGTLDPKVFEQIPRQHFKEINRIIKLSGGKVSVHAPLIEPSGIGEQGWSESNRQLAEKELKEVIEKSYELDPTGNIPVTIHSAGIPGREYEMTKDGKKLQRLIVINQESGQMAPIDEEVKYYPHLENVRKGEVKNPMEEVRVLNASEWDRALSQLTFYKEGADKLISENAPIIQEISKEIGKGVEIRGLDTIQKEALGHWENAGIYLQNAHQNVSALFNKAWKFAASEEDKKILENAAKSFKEISEQDKSNIVVQSQAMQTLIRELRKVIPQTFVPIEDFAMKNSSDTLSSVALHSVKKFGENSPMISIENMYPGMAFAYGEEMENLIKETKSKFVQKAQKEGMSESHAKEYADKLIGMTLDVGHLNIAKKKGFKDEDLKKEVEQIAKYVKHVHLTDNFGFNDSHLPPGMGNVPFKQILETLEKKGFKGRKIVEAGGFVQHFGTSPYLSVLEAMGSPLYAMNMGPYWNQAIGLQQGYLSGYGEMLPGINYQTFGAGFSQLPSELGGQQGGAQGTRMSGRPME
jgi:hypothetical protein